MREAIHLAVREMRIAVKHQKVVGRLRDALTTQKQVVLLARHDPEFRIEGFVVQLGEKWVLIARTRDGGHFNGHSLVRIRSVLRVYGGRSFEAVFARTLPNWPPQPLEHANTVDLDTTKGMLETAVPADKMVGLEFSHRPGAMNIGRITGIASRRVVLQEVDPAAQWSAETSTWRISRIVALTMGYEYQRALASVAGTPPA